MKEPKRNVRLPNNWNESLIWSENIMLSVNAEYFFFPLSSCISFFFFISFVKLFRTPFKHLNLNNSFLFNFFFYLPCSYLSILFFNHTKMLLFSYNSICAFVFISHRKKRKELVSIIIIIIFRFTFLNEWIWSSTPLYLWFYFYFHENGI